MTVSEKSQRKRIAATGFANPLTHDVYLESSAHLKVYADDTLLSLGSDYTVSETLNEAGYEVDIVIPTPGLEPSWWGPDYFILSVEPPIEQASDVSLGGNFGARFEIALDGLARRVQHLADRTFRALKMPRTTSTADEYEVPAPVAGKVIGWNATADGMELYDNLDSVAADAAASAAAADASADAAAVSETNAAASAGSAAASAVAADASADAAAADVASIGTSVSDAAASAAAAAISETNAEADRVTVAADKATVAADKATTSGYKDAAAASAVAADASADAAAISETNADADRVTVAADKATVAADKATVAADKATVAADKATTSGYKDAAAASAVAADASADAAAISEANADADRVTVAADKATVAADKATVAADKATTSTYKTDAQAAQVAAAAAQVAAEAALASTLSAYDSFDDRYLGPKAADPTLDNDGNALAGGMIYYNTVSGAMMVYNGAAWVAAYVSGAGALLAANNLSDVASAATARANLGLAIGSNVQAYDATLAALAALGTAADKLAYTTGVDTWAETALTSFGRSLIDDADAAAGRTTLGLVIGTNVQAYDATLAAIAALGTAADKLAYVTGADTWAETAFTAFARTLLDDADAAAMRTTLGITAGSGVPTAVLEDQKSAGTDGGTFTTGSWVTRTLNTEVYDPSAVISISSNQFTPTVDGWVEWSAPAYGVGAHKTRLYNVTDTVVVRYGTGGRSGVSDNSGNRSVGGAAVTANKTYRVEHSCSSTLATQGLGYAFGSGTEVYTRVLFWRT